MINEFISQIKSRGMARTNRFVVNIPLPQADREEQDIVRLFCDSVQLPGLNVDTAPQRFWGETRQLPYDRSFGEIGLTFYMDTNMTPKKVFDDWMGLIQSPRTRSFNYYLNYTQQVTIDVLELESDSVVYTIELHEAYPKTMSPIQLDASSKDVMKLNVLLAYKYYITKNTPVDIEPFESRTNQDPLSVFRGEGYSTATTPIPPSSFPETPIGVATKPKPINSPPITGQGGKFGGRGSSGGF